jgi:hypothetical protein
MPVITPVAGEELCVHVVAKNGGGVGGQQIGLVISSNSFSDPVRVSKFKIINFIAAETPVRIFQQVCALPVTHAACGVQLCG